MQLRPQFQSQSQPYKHFIILQLRSQFKSQFQSQSQLYKHLHFFQFKSQFKSEFKSQSQHILQILQFKLQFKSELISVTISILQTLCNFAIYTMRQLGVLYFSLSLTPQCDSVIAVTHQDHNCGAPYQDVPLLHFFLEN